MEKIRWGIVGPGNIARKFAEAIVNVDCAELVAVASRSENSGREFAEKYNIPNVFAGYESMAESDIIDAVYIATPHPFHKPCAEIFLNAKKHVLCEKPICVNANQAIELKECAKENGVFLMEAMWTRFIPAILEAKKIADSGEIGDVMGLRADFCYSLTPDAEYKIFDPKMAGGSILDVGIYPLNLAAIFFGALPEEVKSSVYVNYDVDCHTNMLLKYKNGEIASLSSGTMIKKPGDGYIYGTKGYIYLPMFFGASELTVCVNDEERNIKKPYIGNGFEEEIYEACNCIKAGKTESDIMPLDESIRILKLMDKIRKEHGVIYPLPGEENL